MQAETAALLHERWKEMLDDAGLQGQGHTAGLLRGLLFTGAITADDAELWQTRFKRCPGHVGGRVWCAYCGDICSMCGERKPAAYAPCEHCLSEPDDDELDDEELTGTEAADASK